MLQKENLKPNALKAIKKLNQKDSNILVLPTEKCTD